MTAPRGGKKTGSESANGWRHLHLWQIQPLRDVLVIAAVFGLLWLGYKISLVTVPMLLALMLAYLFEPVVVWLTRRFSWMTRRMAAGGLIAAAVIFVVVPMTFLTVWGIAEGTRFVVRQSENAASFVQYVSLTEFGEQDIDKNGSATRTNTIGADGLGAADTENPSVQTPADASGGEATGEPAPAAKTEAQIKAEEEQKSKELERQQNKEKRQEHFDALTSDAWVLAAKFVEDNKDDKTVAAAAEAIRSMDRLSTAQQVKNYITGAASRVASSISLIGVLGFQLFLTAFFFFFFSSGFGKVIEFIRNLLPDKHEDRIVDLAQKMDRVIAGFVRGRLTIAIIQGAIFTIAYFIIGVPGALFLGFAVGFLSIIPYLALIGIPVSIALLFLDGPSIGFRSEWWFMLFAPVLVYFIVQALDDYVWTPMIQGKSTGLDTPTVLFASIAGGALAGFYGLLIAIPVAACVKILIQEVLWPRFKEWREGRATDPLPLGGGGAGQE